jgi:hypothetical protein
MSPTGMPRVNTLNRNPLRLLYGGLATATAERVVAGSRKIELTRVRITHAGPRALERMRRWNWRPYCLRSGGG